MVENIQKLFLWCSYSMQILMILLTVLVKENTEDVFYGIYEYNLF